MMTIIMLKVISTLHQVQKELEHYFRSSRAKDELIQKHHTQKERVKKLMSKAFSTLKIISRKSIDSAPRSPTKVASGVTSSSSTPKASMRASRTFSNTSSQRVRRRFRLDIRFSLEVAPPSCGWNSANYDIVECIVIRHTSRTWRWPIVLVV